MRPVTDTVIVPQPREEIFAYLEDLTNHEQFTNHILVSWQYAGPSNGVGAYARMRINKPGKPAWIDLQIIETTSPRRIISESISAAGRRHTLGTYLLDELPEGGVRITYRFTWLRARLWEMALAPYLRDAVHRANQRSLDRLAARLAALHRCTGRRVDG